MKENKRMNGAEIKQEEKDMSKIIGNALPGMPWQDRPEDCDKPIWRYSENPVIGRHDIPIANSIFNSAVVPFGDGYAGVFRCDSLSVSMDIFAGFSKDAIMSLLLLREKIRK